MSGSAHTERAGSTTASASAVRLAFYGDDFTGSTDALEVLAFAGLDCALFLKAPTPETLARFPRLDAIGVGGGAPRSENPAKKKGGARERPRNCHRERAARYPPSRR